MWFTSGLLTGVRSWTAPRLMHLARMTVVWVLSGAMAGLLAGGVGSRVAMRIAAIAGGDPRGILLSVALCGVM